MRAAYLALAPVVLLASAGCAKPKEKPLVIPSAKSAAPEPTFSRQDPLEAFLGFAYSVDKAEQSLDVNYPGLTTYGQGAALADIRTRIKRFRADGVRMSKPQAVTHAHLVAKGFDKGHQVAKVSACTTVPADDLVDVKTGKPRPLTGTTSQPQLSAVWETIVVLMKDGWHVDGGTVTPARVC